MGRTRQAEPAWQRPDRETVPAQRVRPDPGAMKNLVHDGSLLRKADKTVAELERVEAQLRGVHELIRTTPPAAAPRRQEVLRTWLNLDREHQTAKAGVAQAKRQYDMAKQEYKLGSQEGWRLTNAIRQQRAVQQTTLTALQSSRPQPANLTPGSRSQRAHRTLEACSALHRQSSAALNKAQAQLRQATSQGSPSTALLALNETRQELSERCKKHQSMRDRAQAIVDRLSGNHANDAAQESGPGTSNRANENLETLREQLTTWLAQRNQQRTGLSKARRALEHARQGEQTARASLQEAQLQTRQVGSDASQPLDTECTTLTSLAQSLVEPLRQARATQAQQAQAIAQTQADRTEQLQQHPPGLEHGER